VSAARERLAEELTLSCEYRLRGAGAEAWTVHTIGTRRVADAWRRQVVPVLRRRYPGGVETRVVPV
jgi:hypothetical protein